MLKHNNLLEIYLLQYISYNNFINLLYFYSKLNNVCNDVLTYKYTVHRYKLHVIHNAY